MYKRMYYKLFNAVTDAVRDMEEMNYGKAQNRLLQAQVDCEELYLGADDDEEEEDEEGPQYR